MDIFQATISGDINQLQSIVNGNVFNQRMSVNSVRADGFSLLMIAAECGHIDIVNYLITNGADVNYSKTSGYNALMDAVDEGHYEVVKSLLKNNANPNSCLLRNDYTPLIYACRKGYQTIALNL